MPIIMEARLGEEMGDMTPAELKVFVGVATMLEGGIEVVVPIAKIAKVTGITPLWVRACLRSLHERRVLAYIEQTTGAAAEATLVLNPGVVLFVRTTPSVAKVITRTRRAAAREWHRRLAR